MKKYLICFFYLLTVFLYNPDLSVGVEPEYVMKIAIGNPDQDYSHGWSPFLVFKNEVEARSNGRLKVQLYPLTLGKSSMDMLTEVKEGVIQARDFADGHFAQLYPPIQVFSIPYLFSDREIAWEVLDGPFGQSLIEDMAKTTGLRPLYWSENGGFRHYSNNKRAIHTPSDMKGLKIRTMEIPKEIIKTALSLIQTVFLRDQISLEVDVSENLPRIKCRSQQIQQVLMNLINNARDALNEKYSAYDHHKKITISSELFTKEGRTWVRTSVKDLGIGILPENMENIFDPFFTTKPRDTGTGLGLSISYGIVKEHNGELSCNSEPGKYTEFNMDLPVEESWMTLKN